MPDMVDASKTRVKATCRSLRLWQALSGLQWVSPRGKPHGMERDGAPAGARLTRQTVAGTRCHKVELLPRDKLLVGILRDEVAA